MSNKVTYAEIIEALSRGTNFSKQKSEAFAKALIGRIKEELEENGKASITNFGSFKVKEVAERQGQNPQTGEPITIPAHNRVSFTPYKALKEQVNAQYAHLETELIAEKENEPEAPDIEDDQLDEEPDENIKETIFQFDAEATEDEEGVESEEDEVKKETPFAFDEPEEPETELGEEIELVEEDPDQKPVFEDENGNNMVLIMSIATILAVASVSVWWFFLRSETDSLPAQQAVVEQPKTQQPAAENANSTSETVSESVQENQVDPASPNAEMASADQQKVEALQQAAAESLSSAGANIYEVNQNEWFWVIAEKVYGMSRFWPLIYQENFSLETHPDSLANSAQLTIPQLEGTAENPTKNDYKRLAEASMVVSEAYQKFGRADKAEEYARFAKKWERLGQ